MRRDFFTAQAHVGVGAYEEVMRYLPQETAINLATEHTYDLASYLIAWAMLLTSNCPLVKDQGSSAGVTALDNRERVDKALAILSLIRSYDRCRADTRQRAEHLLTRLTRDEPAREATERNRHGDLCIEALAQKMLEIRLG